MCESCRNELRDAVTGIVRRHGLSADDIERTIREWAIVMTKDHVAQSGATDVADSTLARYIKSLGEALNVSLTFAVMNDDDALAVMPTWTKSVN